MFGRHHCRQWLRPRCFFSQTQMAWREGKAVSLVNDLADFASRCPRHTPRPDRFEVESEALAELKRLVAVHRCSLDDDITSNGDCGLHAIIKNLQRLQPSEGFAQKVLADLGRHGLQHACRLLRLKLCLWLKQHKALELVPEVTVEEWVAMDGHNNIDEYILYMKEDHVWIDTPMLYAASALFQLQFMIFLAAGEAQLLVANELHERGGKAQVGLLANVGNYHFFSVRPGGDEVGLQVVQSRDPLKDACVATANDGFEVEQLSESDEEDAPSSTTGAFFEMCGALLRWEPFQRSQQDGHLAALLRRVDSGIANEDAAEQTLEALQWKSAIKLVQHEEADMSAGIDRTYQLNKGKSYFARKASKLKRADLFVKSRRLCAKLSLPVIAKSLGPPCHRHGKPHSCLDYFRKHPTIVLKWRKMWYSLPKEDREERLRKMFADARQKCLDEGEDEDCFRMQFQVFGAQLCRDAFIRVTSIHADSLQRARKASMGWVATSVAGVWRERRAVAYLDSRAWLLDYAYTHADSSPLNSNLWLPHARKYVFWTAYWQEKSQAGKEPSEIANLKYFLKMWRTELPWIKIRPTSGPFTHCGLCDFLKMMIASAADKVLKDNLNLRLGEHFQFQGAQRVAMSNIFRESETDPDEILAFSWDKMDQAKTVVPRIVALANTQFMKGAPRLVVSLVGVLAPGLSQRPLVYTILEDQVHGADMIASLMVDVVQEAVAVRGVIPRRLFFQADNTVKETKNTIFLFAAAWLLIHLKGTRLQTIECGYLVVGHTHDLVDAMFAYISKALVGKSFLSLPEMMGALEKTMVRPPIWKHLRDVYSFKGSQPEEVSSRRVKGVSQPNHVRLFWSQDSKAVMVQSKHWLTSREWSEPLVLLEPAQVSQISFLWPGLVQPVWDPSFQSSALTWFEKLRALLSEASRPLDGIDHCMRLLRHEEMSYLPSGQTLPSRIGSILQSSLGGQRFSRPAPPVLSEGLRAAMSAAFPGASGHCKPGMTGLLQIGGARSSADCGFCQDELEVGMLALYQNSTKRGSLGSDVLPFRLGKVLRIDRETSLPCAFIECWLPVPKDKYKQANLFGKWQKEDIGGTKRKASASGVTAVNLNDFLVWPILLEKKGDSEGGKISFPALHYLRNAGHLDVSAKKWTFSKRGNNFYLQVAKHTAQQLRDAEG